MHNLMTLWQQRTRRERHLLLGMGVMLIIGLVYYALWQPWQSRETQWRQTLTREQASLQWMRQQTPLLQQLRQQKSPAAPQEPSTVIMREAARHGIAIVRLQPQGARLSLSVQPADFQALMAWLDALGQAGMTTVTLTVAAVAQQPGRVTVTTLVLERSDEK
ncbi:type II secretion system protein GspM [Klebsiella oxytoca]|uniref:type II secretion system protein GspM n=1 Tax=Klebsiella oxytoca TaxID=571 RepID=UPI0004281CDF|nr:type II secretion system protein M [Klebsiella oxytoca]EIX9036306.1 type II secretion system protein M [Klebsiella oxytoca]EIX9048568.1 type II secretion system protein M [Klebsiella oxytoca]EIZ1083653.1 type II secretion system protein M [Klebsiella oxytoca]EKK0461369.1 type II secretion system protein M [Klebsiella oxytoca]ELI8946377.1 type II secretion system protein M [Klebsiella oxytoca]